jgi:restriction endonuclease Mrr
MKKRKGLIRHDKVFYHLKCNFDYRKSKSLHEALRYSIKQLYLLNADDPTVDEFIKSYIHLFQRRINKEIEAYNEFKSYLRFSWAEDDSDVLVGSAVIHKKDTEKEVEYKTKLGNAFLLEDILANLEPDLFEQLCKRILAQLGCQHVGQTRTSGDGGVDFYGTLQITEINENPLVTQFNILPGVKIHFVGQAKRYRDFNFIRPHHIREFLGSSVLLEFIQAWDIQEELTIKNLPAKYLAPRDPTIWIFFSTSFATFNARKLTRRLGIHFQDGEDIARWLALNPLADCEQDKEKLKNELVKWIKEKVC